MPYLQITPSLSLYYLSLGPSSAPAALLIHGLTCDLHDWSWQTPFLLRLGFRVILFDLRGHGRSSSPAPTPGIARWPGPSSTQDGIIDYFAQTLALDAAFLLDHLGVKDAVVMGHSQGDLVGSYLATVRPDLVRASIGVDTIYRWGNDVRDAPAARAVFDDKDSLLEKLLAFFEVTYPEGTDEGHKAWHANRARAMDPDVLYAMCWGGWGERESGLGRTEVAVSEFGGGKRKGPRLTFGCDEEAVRVDREVLKNGAEDEVVTVEGRGHWFHQLEGDKVNGILEAWLGRVGALPVQRV